MKLASNLHHQRKLRGWTATQLSMRCHVTPSMIIQIEKQHATDPQLSTLMRLSHTLECSLDELLFVPVIDWRITQQHVQLTKLEKMRGTREHAPKDTRQLMPTSSTTQHQQVHSWKQGRTALHHYMPENIKHAAKQQNRSVRQCMLSLGVSKTTQHRLSQHDYSPRLSMLRRLQAVFEMPLESFVCHCPTRPETSLQRPFVEVVALNQQISALLEGASRPLPPKPILWQENPSLNTLIDQAKQANTSLSALLSLQTSNGQPPTNRFGPSLHFKRLMLGLSQKQLGDRIGACQDSIQNWEARSGSPRLNALVALCQTFDCDIDALITDRSDYGLHAHAQRLSTWLSA
ncbi:helix-turn-helix domain-containing protein [Vibrio mediterranei]|uniref:helix-turn-helix domain-containing protein n=1 Tax=Vibrio mediterranei TaxID=689 RepID=UPI00148CA9A4|nr:helix-turn-helix transcriptional regulator [Vibrio mediterranei]NOI26515.1 helix-turn-helix transcriptional regulator [Vibrio mediterranei]